MGSLTQMKSKIITQKKKPNKLLTKIQSNIITHSLGFSSSSTSVKITYLPNLMLNHPVSDSNKTITRIHQV